MVDNPLKLGKCTVCIVRNAPEPSQAGFTYLFAADSSRTSTWAFCHLLHM
jgi:hypothetical protein